MLKQFKQWFDKFDALNERERISVILLSVVAIIMIFVELVISPLNQKHDIAERKTASLTKQIQQTDSQIISFKLKRNQDPNYQEKKKISLLDEQITNLNEQLKEKMHGLIEPKQMAKVLEVVLAQNTDLQLQRVQSLGAEPLSPKKVKENEEPQDLGIYRHGLQIEFRGSYLSTLKYLRALDELPWNFYWDVLELNVEKYPVSSIVITVHTLSFHKGWIGV